MTTHSLHLKQATAGLNRMMMSAPGVWKLGQEHHVGGTFFGSQDDDDYDDGDDPGDNHHYASPALPAGIMPTIASAFLVGGT